MNVAFTIRINSTPDATVIITKEPITIERPSSFAMNINFAALYSKQCTPNVPIAPKVFLP
jgi:hypothetical protein